MIPVLLFLLPADLPGERITAAKRILDDWHDAAAKADEARYFNHLTAAAIFMGTDATERWSTDEFRKFAHPYFARGKAWSFRSVRRHVYLSKDHATAWFDEDLDTPNLGPCRGSGVLTWDGSAWKIAHYNLAAPIPNGVFPRVKSIVAAALAGPPTVVFLMTEQQARSALADFARQLERHGGLRVVMLVARNDADVPEMAKLDSADLLVLSAAGLRLPAEQMSSLKKYVDAGRPIVVLNAGKQAFADWPAFDREVVHLNAPADQKVISQPQFEFASLATPHPALQGVTIDALAQSNLPIASAGKPSPATSPILFAKEKEGTKSAVAWTASFNGGRVFATVLGDGDQVNRDAVRRLVSNAVYWSLDRPLPVR